MQLKAHEGYCFSTSSMVLVTMLGLSMELGTCVVLQADAVGPIISLLPWLVVLVSVSSTVASGVWTEQIKHSGLMYLSNSTSLYFSIVVFWGICSLLWVLLKPSAVLLLNYNYKGKNNTFYSITISCKLKITYLSLWLKSFLSNLKIFILMWSCTHIINYPI